LHIGFHSFPCRDDYNGLSARNGVQLIEIKEGRLSSGWKGMHKAGIKEKAGPWFWKISNTYV
jgi:hypothetical protein